ncbi:MAG: DNA polymerase I [Candidatus Dependentiae bacterium]
MKKFDPKKTIFLIDGSSFLYRAYYGLRPLHTKAGEQVQAVYGFIRMIKKLIDQFKPEHIALTWDSPGKTTRHDMFDEYKATRQAPPSDLFDQKEHIKTFADLIGLKQIAMPGIEADDIMYSMACDAKKQGFDVVLITSDKDMGQMLDQKTYIFDTFKDVMLDVNSFEEKMGFPVARLPFYFSLLGDSSDNIPGVRGIGKKGALELVQKFDSLEDVYSRLDEVPKPRMRTALENNKDNAFLSRDLFLLQYYPCEKIIADVAFNPSDWANARPLFAQLNFKSLLKSLNGLPVPGNVGEQQQLLFGTTADSPQQTKKKRIDHQFKKVTTDADLQQLATALKTKKTFALDTETTGIKPMSDPIVGISFATEVGDAWYVPFGHATDEEQLTQQQVFDVLGPILQNPDYKKYLHHAAFDIAVLWQAGVELKGVAFDTMVAAKLVNKSWQKASLKALSEFHLDEIMLSYQEVVKDNKYRNFSYVPLDLATQYAAADAHQTLKLQEVLYKALKQEDLIELYEQIEQPLQDILISMEQEGVVVDVEKLSQLGKKVNADLIEIEDHIIKAAGDKFAGINLNSPKQVQQLLFDELGLPPQKKSSKGSFSTDSEVLKILAKLHPIPGMISKYRELAKLKNTYIDALPTYINPKTNKIHTSFSQTAVATGRLSSSDPNLQNIPADMHGYGIEIRAAFRPNEGDVFVSADYSQVELRVMAHLSQDESLKSAFARNADIHAETAARLFNVLPDEVTHQQRQIGKRINFSVLYGMTPYGLSKDLGVPFKDAKQYIDTYFEQYPGVRAWMDQVVEQTKELGYVATMCGRRRYLPGIYESNNGLYQEAVRVAVNTAVQGTAADIMKIGMLKLAQAFNEQQVPAKILLQIHDELLMSVQRGFEIQAGQIASNMLENVVLWDVPLQVTTRIGADWKEVTK